MLNNVGNPGDLGAGSRW